MELQRDFMLERQKGQMKFSVFKNSNTEAEYLAYCKGEVADL